MPALDATVLCAIVALYTACILPPPVAVQEQVNHEPFIVIETARPQKAFVELNLNCAVCTFTARVEDPDVGDTLYYRWFWDYDIQPSVGEFCDKTVASSQNINAPRNPVSCDVGINEKFGESEDGTIHTLEAWIADRKFIDTATAGAAEPTPLNRALPDDAHVAVKQWTVRVRKRGIGCDDLEQLDCKAKRELQ